MRSHEGWRHAHLSPSEESEDLQEVLHEGSDGLLHEEGPQEEDPILRSRWRGFHGRIGR